MRCIVIDSCRENIFECDVEEITLNIMQYLVGGCIECAHDVDDHNSIYVDEEGLVKQLPYFFTYEGAHQPFAGHGLIAGLDEEGETASTTLKLGDVIAKVKFLSLEEVRASL